MKNQILIGIAFIVISLQSCYQPGDIQIQNNIDQVKISDVRWGSNYIADELLPGEASSLLTIPKYNERLPSSHKITFRMTANNKSIFLETDEEFLLDQGDELIIVLDNDTPVSNPN
ncbi:MAG: hypothetical protein AAF705_13920 [Bacteroidota bacterium]